MLKRSTLFLLFFSLAGLVMAQKKKDSLRYHPNSYRLDLPPEWLKPKTMKVITEILPATIDELKEREFCTSGKADFTVRLLIDSVEVSNEQTSFPQERGSGQYTYFLYSFSFSYRFYAALVLYDSLKRPVSRLRLYSTNEWFDYSKEYKLAPQNGVYQYENVYDTSGKRVVGKKLVEIAKPYITEIPVHNAKYELGYTHLVDMCKQQFYVIRKWLRGLSKS
jgi:hypothetical protein